MPAIQRGTPPPAPSPSALAAAAASLAAFPSPLLRWDNGEPVNDSEAEAAWHEALNEAMRDSGNRRVLTDLLC